MQLVTIDKKLYRRYSDDPELLRKAERPCVVVVNLSYKGKRHRFAVPIRSNISPATPKNEYFNLPPRKTTKPKHRHGIHYAKMFPIRKEYQRIYHTEGNMQTELMRAIIQKNEKQIVSECQAYLDRYEHGYKPRFSTNIDYLLGQLSK